MHIIAGSVWPVEPFWVVVCGELERYWVGQISGEIPTARWSGY